MINTNTLKELEQVIPYKWRVQSFSKNKPLAQCVAYIDARDAQRLLDSVVGKQNWSSDFKEIKGNIYCGIGIRDGAETNHFVWKWDCGTESQTEAEKGEASDAFKRACVQWGIGRFLYDLSIQYIDANEVKTNSNFPYPIEKNTGKRIWDVTEYINNRKLTK